MMMKESHRPKIGYDMTTHIGSKGLARCSAKQVENCPFYKGENETNHYDTPQEAQIAYEKKLEQENQDNQTITASPTNQQNISERIDPNTLNTRSYRKYGFNRPGQHYFDASHPINQKTINYDQAVSGSGINASFPSDDIQYYIDPQEPFEMTPSEYSVDMAEGINYRLEKSYDNAYRTSKNQRVTYFGFSPDAYDTVSTRKNYERFLNAGVGDTVSMQGYLDASPNPAPMMQYASRYSYSSPAVVVEMKSVDGGDFIRNGKEEYVATRPNQKYVIVGRHTVQHPLENQPIQVVQAIAVDDDNNILDGTNTPTQHLRGKGHFRLDDEPFDPENPRENTWVRENIYFEDEF